MSYKHYNLTEPPNKGVQDTPPDWMNILFENELKKDKENNPLVGVKDALLNPGNKGVKFEIKYCSACGKALAPNEVGVCSNCI